MLENINMPKICTIKETAKITKLSEHFIRSLCLAGKIVCFKAGTKILINVDKLIEYLNTGDSEPTPAYCREFPRESIKQEYKKNHVITRHIMKEV